MTIPCVHHRDVSIHSDEEPMEGERFAFVRPRRQGEPLGFVRQFARREGAGNRKIVREDLRTGVEIVAAPRLHPFLFASDDRLFDQV